MFAPAGRAGERARDCSGKPEVCWACGWPDLERKARWPRVSLGHAPNTNCRTPLSIESLVSLADILELKTKALRTKDE